MASDNTYKRVLCSLSVLVALLIVIFWTSGPDSTATPPSAETATTAAAATRRTDEAPPSPRNNDDDNIRRPTTARRAALLAWDEEASLFDRTAAAEDELKLNERALERLHAINTQHKNSKQKNDECSTTRFLFVNTHTWGRHHNQLQEMLHTIAFARRLRRTAVLPFFRAAHKWWDPAEFYDWSLLIETECVVSLADFKLLWAASKTKSAKCLGQGTKATPLSRVVRCAMDPSVPAHYTTKTGFATTRDVFWRMITEKPGIADAAFLGLSGEIAFFLRPGIFTTARLLALLRPSAPVLAELSNFFFEQHTADLTPNFEVAKHWWRLLPSSNSQKAKQQKQQQHSFFSLHLRQRERDCLKEVGEAFETNSEMSSRLSKPQRSAVHKQCAIPVEYVNEQLLKRYQIATDVKMFLASDHENMALEKALVAHNGAVMYRGRFAHASLLGLAVDFFLLVSGRHFSGNQLSSVSQNACFMRLGLGLSCHGFVVDYALHLSAPIAEVLTV